MAVAQTLSPEYVKLAKQQLGEDEQSVPAHVEALRRWLSSMPHLKCPTDDNFLLMFLRHGKYAHARAQARLDNFCTLSNQSAGGGLPWATPIDLKSKELEEYLNAGIHIALEYMKDGKTCMWMRLGSWDPSTISQEKIFYYAYKVFFMMLSDPRAIIGGIVMLLDFTDCTKKHLLGNPTIIRWWTRFLQEAMPARISSIIFYNRGKFLDAVFDVFMFYAKDKMKNRMISSGSNLSIAFEKQPGLQALLPPEVGGTGEGLEKIIKASKKRFLEFYRHGDVISTIKVDESKRPSSARNFLQEYKEYDPNVMGTQGTYIKICQDDI